MWNTSLVQASEILLNIGFTKEEICKLIFEFQPYLISDFEKKVVEYDYDIERYIDIMKKRLELLRREGFKLGIADLTGMYKFLNNWGRVMDAMDKAEMKKDGVCYIKFNAPSRSPLRIKVGQLPFKTK